MKNNNWFDNEHMEAMKKHNLTRMNMIHNPSIESQSEI